MVATAAMLGFAGAAGVAAAGERVGRMTSVAAWTVAHASPVGLDAAPTMVLATAALLLLLWAGARLGFGRQAALLRCVTSASHSFAHIALRRVTTRASRHGGLYGP